MFTRPGLQKIFLILIIAVGILGLSWYTSISDTLYQPTTEVNVVNVDSLDYHDFDNVRHDHLITRQNLTDYSFRNLTIQQSIPSDHATLPRLSEDTNLAPDKLPLKVIIVTQIRSGSSFTGELFNNNDDFMYIFEPLYNFRKDVEGSNEARKRVTGPALRDLMQCNFKEYTNKWKTANYASLGQRFQCRMSKAIQTSPLCTYSAKDKEHRPIPRRSLQGKSIKSILEEVCQRKKYVTIKTIRVFDINDLKGLLVNSSMNVKLIHLVRDPRGLHNSRKAVCKPNWLGCKMPKSCNDLNSNINVVLQSKEWLHDKYLLVRYEDLAMYPRQYSQQIYKFLNIPMPNSENTNHSHSADPYSHSRDGRKVASKWRNKLNLNEVQYVQDHCAGIMQKLGYKKVNSYKDLRNANYSVLEPLNIGIR